MCIVKCKYYKVEIAITLTLLDRTESNKNHLQNTQHVRGVAQSPYPICRRGKASLSEQPPWRAAGDPRLERSRSRVRGPDPAVFTRCGRFFFSTLPSFLLREIVFFRTFPTQPTIRLGSTGWVCHNPNSIRSYRIVQKLSPKHAARGVAQSPCRRGKASLSEQPPWRAAGDPRLARGRSGFEARAAGRRAAGAFFSPLSLRSSFGEIVFSAPSSPNPRLG